MEAKEDEDERHTSSYALFVLGLNSCLLTGDQGLRTVAKHLFSGRRKASGWVEDPITKSSTGLGARCRSPV